MRSALRDAHIDIGTIERAELIISELVTNSVLHAKSPPTVSIHADDLCLRLDVQDGMAVMPPLHDYGHDAITGRGLGVVAATAAAWGIEPHPNGKTVWAQVDYGIPPQPTEPHESVEPDVVTRGSPFPSPTVARAHDSDAGAVLSYPDVDVATYLALEQHREALLRECELLAIQLSTDCAKDADIPDRLVRLVETAQQYLGVQSADLRSQVHHAAARGARTMELRALVEPDAIDRHLRSAEQFTALLEEASALSELGLLLLSPAPSELTRLNRRLLDETRQQLREVATTTNTSAKNSSVERSER